MKKLSVISRLMAAFVLLCCAARPAPGQDGEKREREVRVSMEEVPDNAVIWLKDALVLPRRVTWYKQMSNNVRIYEVKYNWEGNFYSVEFDEIGEIVNIEILRKWSQLPKLARQGMEAYFDSTYTRHRLEKTQVQYTGESERLKTVFSDAIDDGLTRRYELVYRGKDKNEHALWESLFDRDGKFLSRQKVILRPVDNLNF